MHKYYLFSICLIIFSILLIMTGFIAVGSPISARDMQLDTTRLSNFSSLSYAVQTYYSQHYMLPSRLSQLSTIYQIQDPQTKQDYTYQILSETKFNLCTTFSTDTTKNTKSTQNYVDSTLTSNNGRHKKGYDCITYTIPNYQTNNNYQYTAPVGQENGIYTSLDVKDHTLVLKEVSGVTGYIDYQSVPILKNGKPVSTSDLVIGDKLQIEGLAYRPTKIMDLGQ